MLIILTPLDVHSGQSI